MGRRSSGGVITDPHKHGAPARLLASGQYWAMSVKWLRSLAASDRTGARPFDGGGLHRLHLSVKA